VFAKFKQRMDTELADCKSANSKQSCGEIQAFHVESFLSENKGLIALLSLSVHCFFIVICLAFAICD
jgi:hypothetical protein